MCVRRCCCILYELRNTRSQKSHLKIFVNTPVWPSMWFFNALLQLNCFPHSVHWTLFSRVCVSSCAFRLYLFLNLKKKNFKKNHYFWQLTYYWEKSKLLLDALLTFLGKYYIWMDEYSYEQFYVPPTNFDRRNLWRKFRKQMVLQLKDEKKVYLEFLSTTNNHQTTYCHLVRWWRLFPWPWLNQALRCEKCI